MFREKNDFEIKKLADFLSPIKKIPVNDTSKYQKIRVKLNLEGVEAFDSTRGYTDTRPFYIRRKGELIIGKQNFFNGSIAFVPDKFDGSICSNAIMSFNVVNIDKIYLYYYISRKEYLNMNSSKANGTGQKELSEKDFLNFDLTVHKKNEVQEKIGSFLSAIDRLVSAENTIPNHTRVLSNHIMKRIFKKELEFKGSSKNFEKGWAISTLGELSEVITKGTTPPYYTESGVKFIKVENFENEGSSIKDYSYIDEKVNSKELNRSQLKENDILLSIAGTLGKKIIVKKEMLPANTNQALAIIRINQELAQFDYISSNLHEEKIKDFILDNVTTGAQPNLSLAQISKIQIELPPIDIQKKIARLDSLFNKLVKLQKEKLEKFTIVKRYYLNLIFNNEGI